MTNDEVTEGDTTNKETNNETINVSLPRVEARVIEELTKMGGVTKENIDKLIEQVIAEKEKMIFTNVAGKSEADRILRFLRTGQYGYGFKGEGLRIYEPIKKLVDTNNFEAGFFTEDDDIPTTVTVEKGDTLTGLAEEFSTTVQAIKDANNLDSDLIFAGQELIMPIGDGKEVKTKIENLKITYSNDSKVQSIVKSAEELGVRPVDLAAVIAQESSFSPSVVSIDKATNKKYTGLIQFGPYEIKRYNIKENMTFEEQMVAVTKFLKDRGVRPGHGVKEIYAAIFTGNVSNLDKNGANWEDSNGTTVNKALPNLSEGGTKYKMAIDFLQQTGIYAPKGN